MKGSLIARIALLAAISSSDVSLAQFCDAYFPFDGNLEDQGGNGYDGKIIGPERTSPKPQYGDGRVGQALRLDGTSAMRALVDLHPDSCPQVTIAAWIRVESNDVKGGQYLVSTGAGSGPGIRVLGQAVILTATGNGIWQRNAIRDKQTWFFVAGVYDYDSDKYTLYWRNRTVEGKINERHRPPEDALWVGAYNDGFSSPVQSAYIDELRIIGRALSADEVRRLQTETPSALTNRVTAQPIPGISDQFQNDTPNLDLEGRLTSPTELLSGATESDSEIQLLEAPPTFGSSAADPGSTLTAPADDPASELQDTIQNARESTPQLAPITPVDEIVCERPGNPLMEFRNSGPHPERFLNALNQMRLCGYYPRVVTLNDADQWIISAGNQIAHSTNLPAELAGELAEYERDHGQLDAADITTNGAWVIVAGSNFAHHSLRPDAISRLQSVLRTGGSVKSFSMNPANGAQWFLVDGSGHVFGENLPSGVLAELAYFQPSQRKVKQARYMPDGSWVLVGEDFWFVSDGLTDIVVQNLMNLRDFGDNIDHVIGYKSNANHLILSYGGLPGRPNDNIWRVENRLATNKNIWNRLREHDLTGASLAIVYDNRIAWVRGYGLRDSRDLESFIRPDTTFDTASVSKAVSALSLMQLEEDGLISIERNGVLEEVEAIIPSSQRGSFRDDVRPEAGNVIQVLQHCAGFCYGYAADCQNGGSQGGAREYDLSDPLPTIAQVITGSGPALSTGKIVRSSNFGISHRYSSANYMLIQALIDIHSGNFVSHTNRLFVDLGMASSTFVSPYAQRNGGNFARGHADGAVQPTVAYAEMAAASLVSTATDLAHFIIALNQDGQGLLTKPNFDRFVGRNSSVLQYCNAAGDMALGINRTASGSSWGNNEVIWHHGDHNGYHAKMIALPGIGMGFVLIMTGTGTDSNNFYFELKESFKSAYGI